MKTYELMAILRPNLDQEEVDKFADTLEATVKSLEGKVLETEKAGRKRLPYEVKGYFDGYMITVVIDLPRNQVAEFKRILSLNDNIIRTMFLEASKVRVVK